MQAEGRRVAIQRQQAWLQNHRFKSTTRKQPRAVSSLKTAQPQAVHQQAAGASRAHKEAAQAAQRAHRAAQVAQETAKKTTELVRAGLKALWAAAQSLTVALVAGGTAAVAVILVICMVAMVAGSAYGIFFVAEPTGDGISVADDIVELNEEY